MEALSVLQTPASILACVGVITVFVRIGRKDKTLEDHTKSITEHSDALKAYADKNLLTESDCRKERTATITRLVGGLKFEISFNPTD